MPEREVVVSLGSNLGDRAANLKWALAAFTSTGFLRVRKVSPLYETEPIGPVGGVFLNAVCVGGTDLDPFSLLNFLQFLERMKGRPDRGRSGPRQLDLDLILLDREVIRTARLIIPHPRMHLRGFVLFPLREIAPRLVHPVFGLTVAELAGRVPEGHPASRRLEGLPLVS